MFAPLSLGLSLQRLTRPSHPFSYATPLSYPVQVRLILDTLNNSGQVFVTYSRTKGVGVEGAGVCSNPG